MGCEGWWNASMRWLIKHVQFNPFGSEWIFTYHFLSFIYSNICHHNYNSVHVMSNIFSEVLKDIISFKTVPNLILHAVSFWGYRNITWLGVYRSTVLYFWWSPSDEVDEISKYVNFSWENCLNSTSNKHAFCVIYFFNCSCILWIPKG